MSNFKRMFLLVSCFVISIVCGIFALVIAGQYSEVSDYVKNSVDMNYFRNIDVSNLSGCVVALTVIMFVLAIITLLVKIFSSKDNIVCKILDFVVLGLNVAMVISVIIIMSVLMLEKSDFIYKMTIELLSENAGASLDEIEFINEFLESVNIDCFMLLVVACVSNICCSGILSHKCNGNDKKLSVSIEGNKSIKPIASTENDIVKSEIEKLKKELELQDLKREYESLYKKLHKSEDGETEKKEIN